MIVQKQTDKTASTKKMGAVKGRKYTRNNNPSGKGLVAKVFIYTFFPFFLVLLTISFFTIQNKAQNEADLLASKVDAYATLLESGEISISTIEISQGLEKFFGQKGYSLRLLALDGEVLYKTGKGTTTTPIQEEHLSKALQGYEVTYLQGNTGQREYISYIPLIQHNNVLGILVVELPYKGANQKVVQYALFISLLNAAGIVIVTLLTVILLKQDILERISILTRAATEVSSGNLGFQVKTKTKDELGNLASKFNIMSMELKESHEGLEQKVQSRTQELENSNTKLERLNKVFTNRELKMIELKKEIDELKEQLQKK